VSLLDGHEVYQEIKSSLKIYPGLARLLEFDEPYRARRFDYDERKPFLERHKRFVYDETNLIDLTLCNKFDLFVTFTFKKDRHDLDAKKRQMAFWLNNQRILHGKFKYLIVPELHKDGAIHFHALFSGYKGQLVDSGRTNKAGRKIHNIQSYRGGFTTAVKIDNLEKVSSYVAKYITKDMPVFKNKQRYWCSNGLKRPLKINNPLLNEKDKGLFKEVHSDSQKKIFEFHGEFSDKDLARIAYYGRRREDDLIVTERSKRDIGA
jgi:hypothetical protein